MVGASAREARVERLAGCSDTAAQGPLQPVSWLAGLGRQCLTPGRHTHAHASPAAAAAVGPRLLLLRCLRGLLLIAIAGPC